ncbi:unnamed protein product [Penicillium egyptiacum]|uniref:HhH-GPD domain-containing protein n=1 Tax=Penicillium egyptiacum TaxID=1303716 RepID=A0A9W4P251_9EURO|nr:unnamed protein product [Penicillium egyptiacum]
MERRITRSAARAAAALTAGEENSPSVTQAPSTTKINKRKRLNPTGNSNTPNTLNTPRVNTTTELRSSNDPSPAIKKEKTVLLPDLFNELPHTLGSMPAPLSVATEPTVSSIAGSDKENQTLKGNQVADLATELQDTVNKATTKLKKEPKVQTTPTGRKPKKNTYGLTPGISPFSELARPTAEECEDVNQLLSSVHGVVTAPATIPEPSLTVTGCGEVPSVLDALIRTLLSGATTGNNAAKAFGGLVQRFGILSEGIGKGSVNWDAVRQATVKDVFEAIKSGGLADIKSKNLKAILDIVHEDNQARRATLLDSAKNDSMSKLVPEKAEKDKQYEIACADQNFLSLNHLHNLTTEEAMTDLIKYPGIGPKTAACVILFCLQRPCFAVDTHIFRLCRWLGWIPARANEVTAFSHLEVRIPDHLKYSLHQLFIRHGKTCPRCRAATGESSAGWEDGCVIDHLLIRDGKRKGKGPTVVSKKEAATKRVASKRNRTSQDPEEKTEGSESSVFDETSDE